MRPIVAKSHGFAADVLHLAGALDSIATDAIRVPVGRASSALWKNDRRPGFYVLRAWCLVLAAEFS